MAEFTKARGSNFSSAELNQLVASWLHISQDPIVGSAQKNGAFWDRTVKHYNDHKPSDKENRNFRSLESKWAEIKKDVAKFAGCYQNVVDQHFSGESLEDTLRKAKELYVVKDPKGKEIMYVDQWSLLKDCPRFAMSIDDMNQKAAQLKARKQKGKGRHVSSSKENESPNVEGIVNLGDDDATPDPVHTGSHSSDESLHFGEQRPLGNKVAKKQRSDESATKIMAAAQRDMAAISAKRLKLAEKLAERQDRDSLFTLRVEDIDEECRAYFKACRAKELRVAMLKLQREEEEEIRALGGTIRTPLPCASSGNVVAVNTVERSPTKPLKDPYTGSHLRIAFEKIHQSFSENQDSWVQYVLPEDNLLPEDVAAASSAADAARLSMEESSAFDDGEKLENLMAETRYVLSSNKFASVMEAALDYLPSFQVPGHFAV